MQIDRLKGRNNKPKVSDETTSRDKLSCCFTIYGHTKKLESIEAKNESDSDSDADLRQATTP